MQEDAFDRHLARLDRIAKYNGIYEAMLSMRYGLDGIPEELAVGLSRYIKSRNKRNICTM